MHKLKIESIRLGLDSELTLLNQLSLKIFSNSNQWFFFSFKSEEKDWKKFQKTKIDEEEIFKFDPILTSFGVYKMRDRRVEGSLTLPHSI